MVSPHPECIFESSDSSRNYSCRSSSCISDTTSASSTRRSSTCERNACTPRSNRKPHKAHDVAWKAIKGLQSREGSVGFSHFKLLTQVGYGDMGSVHVAQLKGTSCLFAMKVMDKEALSQRNKLQRMHNEREILERLDHPFLPTLYAHFDTQQFSCLVMDFCSMGDLHSLRQRQMCKRFGAKAARFYAAEVLVALEYLHIMGVIYRDLKPENVLVREDGHIMLTDFDLSLKCEANPSVLNYTFPSKSSSKRYSSRTNSFLHSANINIVASKNIPCLPRSFSRRSFKPINVNLSQQLNYGPQLIAEPLNTRSMSFVGTHEYLAPEVIAGNGHGSAVDWWTFGIFLYEMLFGRTPFKGQTNDETLMNIMKQRLTFPEGIESMEFGSIIKSLIQSLLVKDSSNRLGSMHGVAEIKQHPFFQGINWALIRCVKPPTFNTLSFCEDNKDMWIINKLVSESQGSQVDFDYF